jgi:hypothetical protein
MQNRLVGNDWQKAIWKLLKNPALEVVAAIVVVMFAAWIVIQTEADYRTAPIPVLIPR